MSKAQHKLKLIVLPAVLTIAITANYYGFYTIFLTIILHHNIGAKHQMLHFHVTSFTKQGEFGEKAALFGPLEILPASRSSSFPAPWPISIKIKNSSEVMCKHFRVQRSKRMLHTTACIRICRSMKSGQKAASSWAQGQTSG